MKDKIQSILSCYDIGKLKEFSLLTNGYSNENYRIRTNKGLFLLRVCLEKSRKEVEYEIKVLNALEMSGFPASFPIRNTNENYMANSAMGTVVVYDFIQGNQPEKNMDTVEEIARAAARLNNFSNWRDFRKRNALSLELCKNNIRNFEKSKNRYPELFEYFIEETGELEKYLRIKLPEGLVHGDLFPDNTRFHDNKLKAIIDWEEVCTDSLLYDVGVAINGFCFVKNCLDKELLETFLAGYNSVRRITEKEWELLPYYIRWGAHAMIAWHLKHLLRKKETRKLERAEYFMKRVRRFRKEEPEEFFSQEFLKS